MRGFTLLELLVMVIIGLLADNVGPKFFFRIGKSEVEANRAQVDGLGKAIDQFRLDVGHYSSTVEALGSLIARSFFQPGQVGWPLSFQECTDRSPG